MAETPSATNTPVRKGILSFFQTATDSDKLSPSSNKLKEKPKEKEHLSIDIGDDTVEEIETESEEDGDVFVSIIHDTSIPEIIGDSLSDMKILKGPEEAKGMLPAVSDTDDILYKSKVHDDNVEDGTVAKDSRVDIKAEEERKNNNTSSAKDTPTDSVENKETLPSKEQDKLTKKELAAQKRAELKKEKELKKQEREKIRADEKLKREQKLQEEKRKKEELKQKREEEKRKRDEAKLEAKKQKELEKQQREQEKLKKQEAEAKAQLRIGNFFKKVNDSNRTISEKSDYEKHFLPFYARDGVEVCNNYKLSPKLLEKSKSSLDSSLKNKDADFENIDSWLRSKYIRRGYEVKCSAINVLQKLTTKEKTELELETLLSTVPQKYIKFYENVRPPFIGTYSKNVSLPITNPFSTEGTGYNYEYDSDLEWINEEDEEGGIDNLESGEEDEDEDEDDDQADDSEFEGFLDTEESAEANPSGKQRFIGPLIPTVFVRNELEKLDEGDKQYFDFVKVQYLIGDQPFPIDPYELPLSLQANDKSDKKRNLTETADKTSNLTTPDGSPNKKPKSLITEPKDLLKLFDNIQDSTFSLNTITEIVQKTLPQYNKQTIKNTIKEYATRGVGKTEVSRKWELKALANPLELRSRIQE
ncbi:Rlf2p NDAI_0G03560 [Naumovozyma dairenensis CBS 421]|uniref:Uncharacterized protein n=1 Tax=Naumovozyma dairenensis (strain ATCC 10597 / BCRC 20456 / CBS 421 / NBRC 0211 / NRRL Y-12639) TaxID=1071378 RepID=G0WEC2_NAUDC|nr:hypothetical protein NDAI_0G03560 [Naumovozyma dairenensis CBS 421]CCD26133.2 hypothetical protein NDAI_0G03560 [Naumovozyma dairenensis CBS 421]